MPPAESRKRDAFLGSVFPRDVLAANIRAQRGLLNLTQRDLAERMTNMQYVWSRPTVSQVEKAARPVSADELYGLALALNTTITSLLTPRSVVLVDVGLPKPIPAFGLRALLEGASEASHVVHWMANKPIPGGIRLDAAEWRAWTNRSIETGGASEEVFMKIIGPAEEGDE